MGCDQPLLFLDLDGTILDSREKYYWVHRRVIESLGGQAGGKAPYWRAKRRRESFEQLMSCLGNHGIEEQAYRSLWLELIETRQALALDCIFRGVREVLEDLANRRRLIVVTLRRSRANLRRQLRELELEQYFDRVLSSSGMGADDKAVCVRISGLTDGPAAIVGDTEIDIRAGKKLGIPTVGVLSGIRCRSLMETEKPDYLIGSLLELPSLLGRLVAARRPMASETEDRI